MKMSFPYEYTIDTELSPEYLKEALDFIEKYYLLTQPELFKKIKKTFKDHISILMFTMVDENGLWSMIIELKATSPFNVRVLPSTESPINIINKVKEDLFFMIQVFEDQMRQSTLYFAWVEGKEVIPEEPPTTRKRMSDRLFGSNLLLIYLIFIVFNIILFLFIGLFAVIVILAVQFLIILFSDKILQIKSHWRISPKNPYVHIMEYQLPLEDFMEFKDKFGKDTVIEMKNDIYQKTLAVGETPTCQIGDSILEKYGFHCTPENSRVRKINVYRIVKRAADKFELPTPKIVISNTMLPNAAATGPNPNHALVLITTGLLVQLEEDEILAVIGHEMGHLQGRDPLILFSIISAEFLLRFTLLLPIVLISPIIYVVVIMGMIFFLAKFFETRADLLSAMKIGKPKVLAEALRKIGYRKLQMERMSRTKFLGWLTWDPHPPIYFRIDRLESMGKTPAAKNPLFISVKDVFKEFLRTLRLF